VLQKESGENWHFIDEDIKTTITRSFADPVSVAVESEPLPVKEDLVTTMLKQLYAGDAHSADDVSRYLNSPVL